MEEYISSLIPGFLDSIHKVLIYDPVIVSFLTWNIIYKLFDWGYSSENTRRKTALQEGKEINYIAYKDKELSTHHHQLLRFQNVQTNVASYSATMSPSLEKFLQGRSTSPGNFSKMTTEDTTTPKSSALNVKTEEISSSKHFGTMSPTYMLIAADGGDPKLSEMKITEEQQRLILKQYKQLLIQLWPPNHTYSNSSKPREFEEMKHMPGLHHQTKPTSFIKWPVRNYSNLKMHFLRQILENRMMAFPKIVERSLKMYNEHCQIPPKQKCFSGYTEPFMDSSGIKHTQKLTSDIPVPNVTLIDLNLDCNSMENDHIQRFKKTIATIGYISNNLTRKVSSPIGCKKNYKKLASCMTFRSSKRLSRKETDLPIDTILHFGLKLIQAASPKVCINKSPKQMKNSPSPNYKRQNGFLQPGVMEGAAFSRSKLQNTLTKNKTKMIEEHESNGTTSPKSQRHFTNRDYSSPLQEPHVVSYSDGQTSTLVLQHTDPSKQSILKLLEVFTSFKRFLVNTMEPGFSQRGLRTGRTTRKELCQRQTLC